MSSTVTTKRPEAHPPTERPASGARGRENDASRGLPVVLLVDDSSANLLALEAMLRREDLEIVTARSGRDALEVLLERDVAVAIVDVLMPEMDGFELAELVRGFERTRRVPIIFVTAASQAEYRTFAGYDLGAIDFLFKPLDDRVVRAKVDVLVALERRQREVERSRAETEILLDLVKTIARAERPRDIYDPALDAVRDLLGADRAAILLFDQSGRMRFCGWRGLSDAYRAAVDGHSPWRRGDKDAKPILISDVTEDADMARYRPTFEAEQIAAIGFIPLISGDLLGKLMLYWERPRTFSKHDEALAVAIASQVAEALERTRLRNAEREANDQLEQALRENETFAGILGHDLRNPLSAMLTATQLVLAKLENDPDVAPLRRVLASGGRMARMIDELLDFTRARVGGGFGLEPTPADLAKICAQALGEIQLAHPEWTVTHEARGDLSGTWDSDRLLQVVSNLVTNAGQHGTAGGEIRLVLDGARLDRVSLEVHNEGAISEALLANVFSPFRGTRERGHADGLGLGLYIAREIVRSHAGEVTVETSPSIGTTFRIELPRYAPFRGEPHGEVS